MVIPGLGTLINVAAIVAGAAIGVAAGHRLPERVRDTVAQALGLVTLLLGGLNLMSLTDDKFVAACSPSSR